MFANEAKVCAADISLSLLPDALDEFDNKSSVLAADFSSTRRGFLATDLSVGGLRFRFSLRIYNIIGRKSFVEAQIFSIIYHFNITKDLPFLC
jgi:hypothetical protein